MDGPADAAVPSATNPVPLAARVSGAGRGRGRRRRRRRTSARRGPGSGGRGRGGSAGARPGSRGTARPRGRRRRTGRGRRPRRASGTQPRPSWRSVRCWSGSPRVNAIIESTSPRQRSPWTSASRLAQNGCRLAIRPIGPVMASTSAASHCTLTPCAASRPTASGLSSAAASATAPPIENPNTAAPDRPKCSMAVMASETNVSHVGRPPGRSPLRPWPRKSTA